MLERGLSWSLGLILAALLLAVALQELLGPVPNAIFGLIAARSGLAMFEPDGRYATASVQVLAVALILWPRARAVGAGLGLVVAVGALLMHLTPWLGVDMIEPDAATAALAAGHTASEIAAMKLPTDKGAMFLLALAIAVLSAAVIFVERAKVRARQPKPVGAYA